MSSQCLPTPKDSPRSTHRGDPSDDPKTPVSSWPRSGARAVVAGVALAQPGGPFRGSHPRGEVIEDRRGVPDWKVDEHFKKDVFTFVRIEYDSVSEEGTGADGVGEMYQDGEPGTAAAAGPWRQREADSAAADSAAAMAVGRWAIDFPDSDLNFSFRLQQLTSLKVNPKPIHRRLTDTGPLRLPVHLHHRAGRGLSFSPEEAAALRHYLLNGGFLMVDDFWGDSEYENFHQQMKGVFPEPQYEPEELPVEHEIFHCVYRLKEKPQVPSIGAWGGPARTSPGKARAARWRHAHCPLQGDQGRQGPVDGDHLPQHGPG